MAYEEEINKILEELEDNPEGASEFLEEISRGEGTELGRYWSLLADFHIFYWMQSEEIQKVVRKEIREQLEDIRDNWEVIEEEYTQTVKDRHLRCMV